MKVFFASFLLLVVSAFCSGQKADTISFYSTAMKKNMRAVVITPSAYKKNKTERFPVVYLLHGYSGSFNNWAKKMPSIGQEAGNYNCIIVCPDGGFAGWYLDSELDSSNRYESQIIQDLIPYVDKKYRTINDKSKRAITGLSMGGHGAIVLAIRNPKVFGAAGSMSGALDIFPLSGKYEIKQLLGDTITNRKGFATHSALQLADSLPGRNLPLLIDCGTEDFLLKANRDFNQKLLAMKYPHVYIERPGGHTWAYWTNALPYHLLFFRNFFNKTSVK